MVHLHFFLKYRSQLYQTQPDIVDRIEEDLARSVADVEGILSKNKSVFTAKLNENTPGFWLDIYILIEHLINNIEFSKELYGYSLVFCYDISGSIEPLCRFLAGGSGGVFLDSNTAEKFLPYAVFEEPEQWLAKRGRQKEAASNFLRIKELKILNSVKKNNLDSQNEIEQIMKKNPMQNTLFLSSGFFEKRLCLNNYCKKLNDDFPVLKICFGSEGINPLVDAWTGSFHALSNEPVVEEINRLWEFLFQERLRNEVSPFILRKAGLFFIMLLDLYIDAAEKQKRIPILCIDNIHLAEKSVKEMLFKHLTVIKNKYQEEVLILGTCTEALIPDEDSQWKLVFTKIVNVSFVNKKTFDFSILPICLREIAYAISLFGKFFPPGLFNRLFEEEGKNPAMITKAFSILYSFDVIDNPKEPRFLELEFINDQSSWQIPEERAELIKTLVRRRLLSWVAQKKITPCFHLLEIIAGLNGNEPINDLLFIKSIYSDLINGTTSTINMSLLNDIFDNLAGVERAEYLRFIFNSSRLLFSGNDKEIKKAFVNPPLDSYSNPVLKSQILVNLGSYYMGLRDKDKASRTVKDAIILGQDENNYCLPQAYRLFSLVSLSRQKTTETIDYLGFALTNTEKTGNYYEAGLTSFYTAAVQFIYGDVYKAQQFAQKATEQFLAACCPAWADRSRFFEGRLAFEIGCYKEALEIFEDLNREPFDWMTDEKERLLSAWIYRSIVYSQNQFALKPETSSCDSALFEIEAAYLAGEYQKAADLSDSYKNILSRNNFLYTEKPDWSSGFAQCEYIYFSNGEIHDRMLIAFRTLALCHLSDKGMEKAMQKMQQLLRDEHLSEMNPIDAFLFYAWYLVLERTGKDIVELNKAVSMAFKRLQRRASRIVNIETRRQYLNGPSWNRDLCLAAKEFKLI